MTIEKCINDYAASEMIFEEGSTGRELFVVLDGKVDIVKNSGADRTVIVTLGKGEFFGEMAVIDGSARSASAVAAIAGTRVMRINHARFVYLVSQQPAFALMIMDALSKRLRASNAVNFRTAAP
ncbi:MAG: cyclic nucleotide-binding domain-containing protein [Candidatus Afipia apatlaquensis]|uniref:Cyclic nucleotide-binding domain-containing protein n=1 Tax=Candidatus Afipia apatlaquensis TaxID=2712852 RepID=A0A7C9VPQ0_9BRAD|nr:cyclic nucleotide-binding domain-containing protein [Candidatus Afipia apatlaquensis]